METTALNLTQDELKVLQALILTANIKFNDAVLLSPILQKLSPLIKQDKKEDNHVEKPTVEKIKNG